MRRCLQWESPCEGDDSIFRALLLSITGFSIRYGQMTAGSYCYIGPQGIVHGTTVSN